MGPLNAPKSIYNYDNSSDITTYWTKHSLCPLLHSSYVRKDVNTAHMSCMFTITHIYRSKKYLHVVSLVHK